MLINLCNMGFLRGSTDPRLACRGVAAVAEDAKCKRVVFGNGSLAVERGGERVNPRRLSTFIIFRGFRNSSRMSFAQRVVLERAILDRYRESECEESHTICDIALGRSPA
jgi:hypothetical protein